jgi:hypothetical protein
MLLLARSRRPTRRGVSEENAPDKRCRCGHAKGHHMVSLAPDYTGFGWFLVLVGISATPTRARYVCRRCDEVLEIVTDPEALQRLAN